MAQVVKCFEGASRLGLGKEGTGIYLRGVVTARELEAATGDRSDGDASWSDLGLQGSPRCGFPCVTLLAATWRPLEVR